MAEVYSKALKKTLSVERILHKIEGPKKGPTLVFFAGIHGNEPAGVFALDDVLSKLNPNNVLGAIYAINGNLKALEKQQRFISEDLNRIWTKENIKKIKNSNLVNDEESELIELYALLWKILDEHDGPFYFIDLHTTSSKTLPFITINDALINRKFSKLFPVPIVLGIEEYLNGPLLSYINELGYVSLGFESGQHDDKKAIANNVAFINLTLMFSGSVLSSNLIKMDDYYDLLKLEAENEKSIFEVIHLHPIKNGEDFNMLPNFKSFQPVKKGTPLAISDNKELKAQRDALLFMPLYQKKGKDGYFLIKRIEPFFLKLSSFLRFIKADGILPLLPGISWDNKTKNALLVNLKVTKYLARPIFHLLGYRSRQVDKTHLKIYNRERVSKLKSYKDEFWF